MIVRTNLVLVLVGRIRCVGGIWTCLALALWLCRIGGSYSQMADGVCPRGSRNETTGGARKEVYRVGVLAIRGKTEAFNEFNKTFSEYLTATAGARFDPPIRFEMKGQNFIELFDDVNASLSTEGAEGVDFIYVNPSAYSCIESEYGANSLVSQISRRVVGGVEYTTLTKFGGVIFARRNRTDINTIEDIRGKSVAAASISGLGSGQMQFRLMQQRGLSYIQDPKQLIFTSDQGKVVNGVLYGDFDVGFVRTDQIERTKDKITGELVDKSQLKIIEGFFPELDGKPFPFESSTVLYSEWNVGSLPNVPDDVAEEVQRALLNLDDYAAIGQDYGGCLTETNCTNAVDPALCESECFAQVDKSRCDATAGLAFLAFQSKTNGKYTAWRSTLSYMELRNMQEETRFIRLEEDGVNRCIRSSRIYDAIVCPPGHFRKSEQEVSNGCDHDGYFNCTQAGFQCLCSPCLKAFDVAVFEKGSSSTIGCDKFEICGQVEQSKAITFQAVDNKERSDFNIEAVLYVDDKAQVLPTRPSNGREFSYEFSFDANEFRRGTFIIEVKGNGIQIPESPFRVQVFSRDCSREFNDKLLEPNEFGHCVCRTGSVQIGDRCAQNAILIPSIIIPLLLALGSFVVLYVEHKRKQADSVWAVNPDDLRFDDPPAILGRGTFGLVLLAEYRGTQVAVKRVIPPKIQLKRKIPLQSDVMRNSLLGDGELNENDLLLGDEDSFHVDFDEKELRLEAELSAMEPSVTDSRSIQSTKSKTRMRRSSLTMKQTSEKAVRRNSLFDFENLKDGDCPVPERRGSHGGGGGGLESGGLEKILGQLRDSESSIAGTAPKPPAVLRRRSIGAFGPTMDFAMQGITKENKEKVQRRSSEGSIGSSSSGDIENQILSTSQIFCSEPPPMGNRHSFAGFAHRSADSPWKVSTRPGMSHAEVGSNKDLNGDVPVETGVRFDGSGSGLSFRKTSGGQSSFSMDEISDDNKFASTDGEDTHHGWTSTRLLDVHASKSKSASHSGSQSVSPIAKLLGCVLCRQGDEYARLKADFIVEMRHLSKLRHPCITTVMGAVISNRSEPMLVMECMDHGSLYDLLHNDSMVVDGELVLPILRDIAQGVRFLHAANPTVIHGDLKAQNVLVDSKFRAKVADFGLSQKKRVGATGTPLWMAPELLRGETDNTPMSDVYSFGIILYEVYSRKDPYDGENHLLVLQQVADPKLNKRPRVPEGCPATIASIMADCLAADPASRPPFEELDVRLKRLDVENVEPALKLFSKQRKKKDYMAARNEELLFQVFPRHIAEALRDGRKVEAESFDCVTIYFSDIVGYTTICSKLPPKKVSDMLDRLYSKFDQLVSDLDIWKMETIGDAYMCVTNLNHPQEDHAARLARFAMSAVEASRNTLIDQSNPSIGYVRIRVGFHSGPVVANVVGTKMPKYTLFGDTVNTASRMESNSQAMRIQCSDRAAELVQAQDKSINVVPRGKIPIKGKGDMFTYWVGEDEVERVPVQGDSAVGKSNLTLQSIAENQA